MKRLRNTDHATISSDAIPKGQLEEEYVNKIYETDYSDADLYTLWDNNDFGYGLTIVEATSDWDGRLPAEAGSGGTIVVHKLYSNRTEAVITTEQSVRRFFTSYDYTGYWGNWRDTKEPSTHGNDKHSENYAPISKGSYTPTLYWDDVDSGASGNIKGIWTKIGDQVFATINLDLTSRGTANAGDAELNISLPFDVADRLSNTGAEGFGPVWMHSAGASSNFPNLVSVVLEDGDLRILSNETNDTSSKYIRYADVTDDTRITTTITYTTSE